jgi:hypothetical protein
MSQTTMDPTKPPGEACTPDGHLKEADEINWVHDPDDVPMTTCKSTVVAKKKLMVPTLIRQEHPNPAF